MLNIGVMFRNNEQLVVPFFFFLRKSTTIPIRVYALNQASSDNTESNISACLEDNDVLVNVCENLGCAGGRNKILTAMVEREGDYHDIVLIDSDAYIILHKSIENMAKTNGEIVYGRTIAFYDQRIGRDGMCFCLIRGEVFNKIGCFNDRFKLFYDDTIFAETAITSGIQPVTCENSLAVHMLGSTIRFGSESHRAEACYNHDKDLYNELR